MLGRENRSNHNGEFARPITCPSPTNLHLPRRARVRADGQFGKTGTPFPPVLMPLRIVAQLILFAKQAHSANTPEVYRGTGWDSSCAGGGDSLPISGRLVPMPGGIPMLAGVCNTGARLIGAPVKYQVTRRPKGKLALRGRLPVAQSVANVDTMQIECFSDHAEQRISHLAPLWKLIVPIRSPCRDHRKHEDPAVAK